MTDQIERWTMHDLTKTDEMTEAENARPENYCRMRKKPALEGFEL